MVKLEVREDHFIILGVRPAKRLRTTDLHQGGLNKIEHL